MQDGQVNMGSAPTHTLNDLRVVRHEYAASGGLFAKALRPILIVVIVIAAAAGVAWKMRADAGQNATKSSVLPAVAAPVAHSLKPVSQ